MSRPLRRPATRNPGSRPKAQEEAQHRIAEAHRANAKGLDLSELGLTTLPPEIARLSALQYINLNYNQITALPPEIACLTELQELHLNSNLLTALPPEVARLTALQTLDLSANQLIALPPEIARLTALQTLILYGNPLKVLPPEIASLTSLYLLALADNQLTTLPPEIAHLAALKVLDLDSNQLTTLPPEIAHLTALQHLDLSNNQLTDLPTEIARLIALQSLDLDSNQLTTLPTGLRTLPDLRGLYLHNNPDLNLPAALLGATSGDTVRQKTEPANPADILAYYFGNRQGGRPLNQARLILVGFGAVGKTSLIKRLTDQEFDKNEPVTKGIAIAPWTLPLGAGESATLNIWDFGGQEIMHHTHQFFLAERCLYLLVLNGRDGRQNADAEYWLSMIGSHAQDSPVIVVRNKIHDDPCALDRNPLRAKYPAIRDVVDTDCTDNTGIATLKAAIARETESLPDLRANFPAAWFAIKDRLRDMGEDYIGIDRYRALCAELGETDTEQQDRLSSVLHHLGMALNYRSDQRLHDTNVLKPEWVTGAVYTILNHPILTAQNGEFRIDDLATMLDGKRYPRDRHGFIVQLMKKFELAMPFPEHDDRFLIPEQLPVERPEGIAGFDPATCLNFEYKYETLLPHGLLPRFIVRSHSLIDGGVRWRGGVVLGLEGNRALVTADTEARVVRIRIDGPVASRRRLLAVIRYDLDRIHGSYKFSPPAAMVPVPGHPSVTVKYGKLLGFERAGRGELPEWINDAIVPLNVRGLLDGVDLGRAAYASPFPERAPRLFVSYAHADESLREELDIQLKILTEQYGLLPWHDRRLIAGEDWAGKIDENLRSADIVLLLLSADFLASAYCRGEMAVALERESAEAAIVVPVILRICAWEREKVQKNQALPKGGRPIASVGPHRHDRDAPWHEVYEGLEKVLKQRWRAV